MTHPIGAQLTALSIPGQGNLLGPYFAPYGAGPGYWYMSGPSFREPFRPYGRIFFGAEDPSSIDAPAPGGILVRKHLDDRQVLHVEICVDGKCHSTSMDLAPAIAMLLNKLKALHEQMHASQPPPETVVSTIENAVSTAGDVMVESLVGQHVVMMGGWLSSLGNAIGSTLRKLGPVISTAAVAAATAYGGPAAGAAAAKLAPVITNLQANALDPKGNPARKAAAQKALQQISQEAATDPAKAQALTAATQAVKNTAVAYHVKDAVDRAAVGDETAKTDINNLVQAADQGDQGAKSTMEILAVALAQQAMKSEEGAKLWEQITGRGPGTLSPGATPTTAPGTVSGWYDVIGGQTYVGGFWGSVKNALLTVTLTKQTNQFIKDNKLEPYVKMAATAVATAYGGPAAGAAAGALAGPVMSIGVKDEKKAAAAEQSVQRAKGVARSYGPEMGQAADVAQVAIDQTAMTYQMAAIVKAAKLGDPDAQKALADLRAAAAAGDVDAQQAVKLADTIDQELSNAPPPPVGQWHDLSPVVIGCGCTHSVGGWHDITVGQDISHPLLVAVYDANGRPTPRQVMWHPTHDQIAKFGGSTPAFYTEYDGGLFIYRTAQGKAFANLPGPYTAYRPTWPVMYWSEGQASTRTSGSSTGYMGPAQAQAVIGRWHEIIGAAIDATREQARAHATTKQGNAAGVILTADGRAQGRGFRTLDAAIDWLQHITRNHRSFTYAAAYEKDRAGNAFIQAEEFGTAAQPMQQVALK